ncbi:MAG: hypothetical protein M0023_14325 [Desulfobacteraceae bacterium]|nr:hypothetical protein [Desulfobacteraceae bacterium]
MHLGKIPRTDKCSGNDSPVRDNSQKAAAKQYFQVSGSYHYNTRSSGKVNINYQLVYFYLIIGSGRTGLTGEVCNASMRTMTSTAIEERRKAVKHKLIDLGMSFRKWCEQAEVNHSVARDLLTGRMDASRSRNIKAVKDKMIETFGEEIFRD